MDTGDDKIEHIPVDMQCIIPRTFPPEDVSAYWTKQSTQGKHDAGSPAIIPNEDGTYRLTYTTELTFTPEDHYELLSCHSTWDGDDDYSKNSTTVTVQCECQFLKTVFTNVFECFKLFPSFLECRSTTLPGYYLS